MLERSYAREAAQLSSPRVAVELRDMLSRSSREVEAIVGASNCCWQRKVAAVLVQILLEDEDGTSGVIRVIDLILANDA